jgi:hypothetical protein
LAGFNNGALAGYVGELERCSERIAVLVQLDSVVTVGSVGRDSVGSLRDCNESSKGADERCFELHGYSLSMLNESADMREIMDDFE